MLFVDVCIPIAELNFGEIVGRGSFGVVHQGLFRHSEVALKCIRVPPGANPSFLPTPTEVSVLK